MIKLNLGIGTLLTPADVFDQSYLYIVIILVGMFTTIAYNGCVGFLRTMGNSRTPLYFLILSSLLNLGLDALFVILLHTGIAGAAPATVIAQAVSATALFSYSLRRI